MADNEDDSSSDGILTNVLKSSGADKENTNRRGHHHHRWREGLPKNQGSARWGLTKFADMSPEEFQTKLLDPHMLSRLNARQPSAKAGEDSSVNMVVRKKRAIAAADLPTKVDWRTKGVVTPVKHQKNCGACWAFSTVEVVESMQALQKGVLKPLSVQQVNQ